MIGSSSLVRRAASRCRAGRAGARRDGGLSITRRGSAAPAGRRVVAPSAQLVHERLGHVLDRREPARHVAVERRVPDRRTRSCSRWPAPSSRTCWTAPSAGCRGSAPAGSPRPRPRRRPRRQGRARTARSNTSSMGTASRRMPAGVGDSPASSMLPGDEYGDGIASARTGSGPSASAASVATSAESMPPESPSTTSRNPFFARSRRGRAPARGRPPRAPRPGRPRVGRGRRRPSIVATTSRSSSNIAACQTTSPSGATDHRAAVEHQLVLAADGVDVHDPRAGLGGALPAGRRAARRPCRGGTASR